MNGSQCKHDEILNNMAIQQSSDIAEKNTMIFFYLTHNAMIKLMFLKQTNCLIIVTLSTILTLFSTGGGIFTPPGGFRDFR